MVGGTGLIGDGRWGGGGGGEGGRGGGGEREREGGTLADKKVTSAHIFMASCLMLFHTSSQTKVINILNTKI